VPAPAVIPAPIAYIKVVAVKKLVVEIGRGWAVCLRACTFARQRFSSRAPRERFIVRSGLAGDLYFEKIRVFKAGICSDTLAWNNGIGRRSYFVGF